MAKAFQCDVCGRFESEEPVARVTFSYAKGKTQSYELCSPCLAATADVLNGQSERAA